MTNYPNITNAQAQPYSGTPPVGISIGLDTPLGNMPPRSVNYNIDWSLYPKDNRNAAAVYISLAGLQPANRLDQIRAVRVENKNSNHIIWLLFASTGQIIECLPGVTMEPVITASDNLDVVIYAEGFVSGQLPQTNIEFLNVNRAGYYIPEDSEASVSIQYLGNQRQLAASANLVLNPSFNIPAPISGNTVLFIGGIVSANVIATGLFFNTPVLSGNTIPANWNGTFFNGKRAFFGITPAPTGGLIPTPGAIVGGVNFDINPAAFVNVFFYLIKGLRSILPTIFMGSSPTKSDFYVQSNSGIICLGQQTVAPLSVDFNSNSEMASSSIAANEGAIAVTDANSQSIAAVWR